uniref:Amino acid permease N-terminal domain-containing protein n=1 Tax=Romanomermis culicivorax TaxID=13658 RepID=A0A915KHR6_ROMCU
MAGPLVRSLVLKGFLGAARAVPPLANVGVDQNKKKSFMIKDSNHKDSGVDGPNFRPGYVNRAYENYSPKFSNVSTISLSVDDDPSAKNRKISVLERVPHIDHYKESNDDDSGIDASRPTLRQLHQSKDSQARSAPLSAIVNVGKGGDDANNHIVVTPTPSVNPVNWVGAHAGSGFGALIIVISSFVATLTALSMCAICTNGEVKA